MKKILFYKCLNVLLTVTLCLPNPSVQSDTHVDEADNPQLLWALEKHRGWVYSVAFSPDGQTLASGSSDATICLWNAKTGQHLQTLTGHNPWVLSVSFSSDGQTLASGGYDMVRLWDVKTGRHLKTIQDPFGVLSVAFLPGEQTLATYGSDSTVRLWDAKTGRLLRTLTENSPGVGCMSFSSDGQKLAGGNGFGTISLWEVKTGSLLWAFEEHTAWVNSVSFSSDGQTFASGSEDGQVILWDVNTGQHLEIIRAPFGVSSMAFRPGSQTLASGNGDGQVSLWDVNTGRHLRTLIGHTGVVRSVSFSPDGQLLASGSGDRTVLIWKLNPTPSLNSVHLTPDTVASPNIDEQITFSLNIVGGQNIAGYQAAVQFDNTALRYVQSDNGTYLPTGSSFTPPQVEGNTVQLAASSLAGETMGHGILVNITFEIVAVKSSTVLFSDVILTNSLGETTMRQTAKAEITAPPQLPADVNDDGVVNIADLTLVASNFGKTGENVADVNADGVVNIVDLSLVARTIGKNADAAPTLWEVKPDKMPTRATVESWLQQAQQLNRTDARFQSGIAVLEQFLVFLTPKKTALLANYPNPFNPETWIPFQLAAASDVTLTIYASDGTLVRTLALGHKVVGIYQSKGHAAYWDGKNEQGEPVASGVYYYTLTAGEFSTTRKMLIRK